MSYTKEETDIFWQQVCPSDLDIHKQAIAVEACEGATQVSSWSFKKGAEWMRDNIKTAMSHNARRLHAVRKGKR